MKTVWADLARRWQLISLIEQFPLPLQASNEVLDELADRNQRENTVTWNLCLRLLLRRVFAAPAADKPAVWRDGIARLREVNDGKAIYDQTFADLDRFLLLPDAQRSVPAVHILTDLMTLVPDLDAMRKLTRRRVELLASSRDPAQAASALALELLLTTAANNDLPDVLAYARSLTSLRGVRVPALAMLHLAPAEPGSAAQRQPLTFDTPLIEAARAILLADDNLTDRRRTFLSLFVGDLDAALRSAHRNLQWTAHGRVTGRFEEIGLLLTALTRDSQKADLFAAQLTGDSDEFSRLATPAARDILEDEAATPATIEQLYGDQPASPVNLFGAAPAEVRIAAARAYLDRLAARRITWASRAIALGDADLAVNFWAEALNRSHAPAGDTALHQQIAAELRDLRNTTVALAALQQLADRVSDPSRRALVKLTRASFCYEQGMLAEALADLDAAEPPLENVEHDQRMVAGLIRSVCHIKLGDLDAAAQALRSLESLDGDNESHAQVLFLRGWIHLNHNEPDLAAAFFRRIADEFPATTYRAKAAEVMAHLADAIAAPASQ